MTSPPITLGEPYSWPERIDTRPPALGAIGGSLWAAREQPTDHRAEGYYANQPTLSVPVSDAGSGVKEVVILKDGVQWGSPATITGATANWAVNLDSAFPDGRYKIEIAARDNVWTAGSTSAARHETKSAAFYVTIDRHGDVYTAEEFSNADGTGPPDAGEHTQLSTGAERRVEDGLLSTRRRIQCPEDGSAQCLESRRYAATSEVGDNEGATLAVQRGTSVTDMRVGSVATTRPSGDIGPVVQTGPLNSVLVPWQVPPPGHGMTYALRERSETGSVDGAPTEVTERHWIEQQTGLVVRRTRTIAASLEGESYYSYLPRSEASSLPVDFFKAGGAMTPTTLTTFPAAPQNPPVTHDPEPTFAALFADSQRFRELFGLPPQTESAVRGLTELARALALEEFGALLLPGEIQELRERDLADAAMSAVDDYVSQSAPATYAGAYIDQEAGGLVRVAFTVNASQHLAALQARFSYPDRLRTYTVGRTANALEALRMQVDTDLPYITDTMGIDVGSIETDVAENVVRITAYGPTESQSNAIAARYGPGVRLVAGDEFLLSRSRFRVFRPGLAMAAGLALAKSSGGECSSAFSLKRGTRFRVLTAGHCGPRGTIYRRYRDADQTGTFPIGVSTARQLKGELDVSLIAVPRPVAITGNHK